VIEFEMNARMSDVAERLEELISPQLYYLPSKIGGHGWEVRNSDSRRTGYCFVTSVIIKLEDDAMASYVALILSR
jgi:hypothetical protein